jgi:hypothetical protein
VTGPSASTAARTSIYNAPPETSRLLGFGSGNGSALREGRDVRGSGNAADGEDLMAPGDSPNSFNFTRHAIRSNNMDKSIEAKKKV